VWFRRARFFIFAPDSQAKHACRQAEFPLNALFKIPEPPLFARAAGVLPELARAVRVTQVSVRVAPNTAYAARGI
jgi:hypothetical protein